MSFKRSYTKQTTGIESFALVAISGGCTFSGVLDGTYVDVVTGDKKRGSVEPPLNFFIIKQL